MTVRVPATCARPAQRWPVLASDGLPCSRGRIGSTRVRAEVDTSGRRLAVIGGWSSCAVRRPPHPAVVPAGDRGREPRGGGPGQLATASCTVPALRGRISTTRVRPLAETRAVTSLVVDRQKLTSARTGQDPGDQPGALPSKTTRRAGRQAHRQRQLPAVRAGPGGRTRHRTTRRMYVSEHQDRLPRRADHSAAARQYPQRRPSPPTCSVTSGQINADEYKADKADGLPTSTTSSARAVSSRCSSPTSAARRAKKVEVDNRGIKIGESIVRPAVPGHDVHLTVDLPTPAASPRIRSRRAWTAHDG